MRDGSCGIRQTSARNVERASGVARTAGLGRGRHVRSHSRRSAAAGAVSRAVGLMRGALAALQDGELTWEIVYTSPSLTGVRAAALAGLAITPLPASAVIAGLRILDA